MAETKTPTDNAPDGKARTDWTVQCRAERLGRCRLLPLSLALALLLHAAAGAALLHVAASWQHPDLAAIYTVDLVAAEGQPEQEPETPPEPPPPPPELPPRPEPAPEPPPPPPPPTDIRQPTVQPPADQPPSPPQPPSPTEPSRPDVAAELGGHGPLLDEPGLPEAGEPIPGVTSISPVAPPPPSPKEQVTGPDLPGVVVTDKDVQVGGLFGFAGMADTFALEQVGADVFTEEEYTGHYITRDGRFIDVVDARDSEGMLILHRPANGREPGLVRGLTRYGKMIYTHGATLLGARPVEGTVYLLPKKARYNDENIDVPNQLMWMPRQPPMQYAEKVAMTVRDVTFEAGGVELSGVMVWPGGDAVPGPGAVLAVAGCPPPSALLGMARRFALHGLAVLAFAPRGCDRGDVDWDTALPGRLTGDVLAAATRLRMESRVDPDRVGVVGLGSGAVLALKAAADPDLAFAAMTCPSGLASPERCALPVPRVSDLLRARAPLAWLLPPGGPGRWDDVTQRVSKAGLPGDTVRILPDPVPPGTGSDEARWLRLLDHAPARETADWAASLP